MKPNVPVNRKGTFVRLMRTLFEFFPVLMPVALVCILFSAIVGSLPTVFMQKIIAVIENYWQAGDWAAAAPQILRFVAILATMYGLALISTIVWTQLMAIITQGLLKKLRVKMFDGMQNLPLRYFDTNDHGDIMSHYTNDIDTLRQMVAQSFPQLLSMFVTILSVLFIMLYYSFWLSLVILLGSLVMVKFTRSIGGKSAIFFQRQQKSLGKVEGFVEELMDGQKVVKVFCHESETCADFDRLNDALMSDSKQANTFANTLMPILMNTGNFIYALVAIVGGILLITHAPNLSFSGMAFGISIAVPFLNMTRQFTGTIGQVSQQINLVVMGMAGAQRIFELMDEEPEVDQGNVTLVNVQEQKDGTLKEVPYRSNVWAWKVPQEDGSFHYTRLTGDVRFEHVDFGYVPEKTVLHDISLFAKPGQKVAFVGATGAGKTTITNLINRFYDIHNGHRHRHGQHPLWSAPGHRRGVHRRRQAGRRPRLHHPPAPRLQHHAHQQRRQPLPGSASAAGHRPGGRGRSPGHDYGRGHLLHRYPHRGHCAKGHGRPDVWPHRVCHRPPALHRQEFQRHHGAGTGPHH